MKQIPAELHNKLSEYLEFGTQHREALRLAEHHTDVAATCNARMDELMREVAEYVSEEDPERYVIVNGVFLKIIYVADSEVKIEMHTLEVNEGP